MQIRWEVLHKVAKRQTNKQRRYVTSLAEVIMIE